jgi:iron complex outermembrane recepter protein
MAHATPAFYKAPSIVLASILALGQAYAQSITALEPVVVKASAPERAVASDLISIGDAPLSATPLSATIISSQQIEAAGAKRLADLNKMDASVSDAYNAVGYWDYATVRGFVIDNKYNYRREGLPISAETAIGLDNKASVEVLKGTSGLQAGTSAPGGLVNYLVKRPTNQDLRSVRLEANSNGSFGAAVDLGGRFGVNDTNPKEFGCRINAAADKLDSYAADTKGNRQLLAVAGDWRINADSLLQLEVEYSHRAQRSVPGLSLLGNALPSPNAKLNINSQAWSQPVVLDGLTGSVKFDQAINADWRWTAQLGSQQLRSQDRTAFPFGCSVEGNYDKYCSNGTFDLYDYRSENERRSTIAAQAQLKGQLEVGGVKHSLGFGLLSTRVKDRFDLQAYNYSGEGSIYTVTPLPADASLVYQNTNRSERSTELSVSDTTHWNSAFTTWAGLRYTQLKRNSVLTDGTQSTDYSASFAAPWLAASYKLAPSTMAYASFGQGVESSVAPNQPQYSNAGRPLPSLKSTQYELGVKGRLAQTQWTAAVFDIKRPLFGNAGACDGTANSCAHQLDGTAKHRGLELTAATPVASAQQPWHLDGSITAIQAQRQGGSIDPSLNGLRPINVPNWIARLNGEVLIAAVPGLTVQAHVSHEGRRVVTADNSINLPAWTRLDLGLRYEATVANTPTTWTLGIDNVFNQRYFSESPTSYGHVYLFTAAPRTVRLSVQVAY